MPCARRVPLHPLAARFADVAGAYERGRPDYPPAVVGALAAELGLDRDAPVLDLAAGTGKLTRALLAFGLDVIAVEPLPSLREVLAERVGEARVREGVAESIPLPDGSVDAVTVADAFHWFDHASALAEIGRVLGGIGGLAVLTTVPDWRGASWADELGQLMAGLRPSHPQFDGPSWREAVREARDWSDPREIRLTVTLPASPQRVIDYMSSVSWIAALGDDDRADALDRVTELVHEGETPDELPVHVMVGLAELGPD